MGDNAQYKQEFNRQTNGESTAAGKGSQAENSLTDSQTGTEVGPSVLPEPTLSPEQGYVGTKTDKAWETGDEKFNYTVTDSEDSPEGDNATGKDSASGPISKYATLD